MPENCRTVKLIFLILYWHACSIKMPDYILSYKSNIWKIFEGESTIETLLQLSLKYFKFLLHIQIFNFRILGHRFFSTKDHHLILAVSTADARELNGKRGQKSQKDHIFRVLAKIKKLVGKIKFWNFGASLFYGRKSSPYIILIGFFCYKWSRIKRSKRSYL